jgi:hypothetical protein
MKRKVRTSFERKIKDEFFMHTIFLRWIVGPSTNVFKVTEM